MPRDNKRDVRYDRRLGVLDTCQVESGVTQQYSPASIAEHESGVSDRYAKDHGIQALVRFEFINILIHKFSRWLHVRCKCNL
jgi:glycosylphosphatidylinositol transamidase (GPIT) subunit GPI8